jgi:hypothetical protein
VEQGLKAQVLMAVGSFIVIIEIAGRHHGEIQANVSPNITEITLCQRRKRDIPTEC